MYREHGKSEKATKAYTKQTSHYNTQENLGKGRKGKSVINIGEGREKEKREGGRGKERKKTAKKDQICKR